MATDKLQVDDASKEGAAYRPRKPAAYTDDPALYRQSGMELIGPPIAKAGR